MLRWLALLPGLLGAVIGLAPPVGLPPVLPSRPAFSSEGMATSSIAGGSSAAPAASSVAYHAPSLRGQPHVAPAGNLRRAEAGLLEILAGAPPPKGTDAVETSLEVLEASQSHVSEAAMVGDWRLEFSSLPCPAIRDEVARYGEDAVVDMSAVLSVGATGTMDTNVVISLLGGEKRSMSLHRLMLQNSLSPSFSVSSPEGDRTSVEVTYLSSTMLVIRTQGEGDDFFDQAIQSNGISQKPRQIEVWRKINEQDADIPPASGPASLWRFGFPRGVSQSQPIAEISQSLHRLVESRPDAWKVGLSALLLSVFAAAAIGRIRRKAASRGLEKATEMINLESGSEVANAASTRVWAETKLAVAAFTGKSANEPARNVAQKKGPRMPHVTPSSLDDQISAPAAQTSATSSRSLFDPLGLKGNEAEIGGSRSAKKTHGWVALMAAQYIERPGFDLVNTGMTGVTSPGARSFVSERRGASTLAARAASRRAPRTQLKVWDTEWMSDPVVSAVGWTVVSVSALILRVATAAGSDDTETPSSYLQGVATAVGSDNTGAESAPVICVGDSLTRGNLSADWVQQLRQQLTEDKEDSLVLNAGVNMHCSKNIQERLSEVIACKPSHVSVLVGTNDLKAELSPIEGFMYQVFGELPEVPTLENYENTLREIREALLETGASVALVSPPVLGEDRHSTANQRAAQFAATVKRVAEEGGERCAYLPLFERTSDALPAEGGKDYCGLRFFSWLCLLCIDLHVFRKSLAQIQSERNLGVTVDLVHLGPAAATVLADMVADFVREVEPTGSFAQMELATAGGSPR